MGFVDDMAGVGKDKLELLEGIIVSLKSYVDQALVVQV